MSDLVNQFKAKVDAEEARYHFSEMTDAETPIWIGGPTPFSMLGRYVLTALVLLIHMMFFWAAKGGDLEGEGQLNFVLGLVKILLDISGVTGFVVVMLVFAKINHYLNFSTSGGWTTKWLVLNGLTPFLLVLADWSGALLGIFIEDIPDTPRWLDWYYLVLGIASAGSATILTLLYQRAFMYAITDRRIHIRKQFLYFHSSIHGISFADIENLKAAPSVIGRLLGFGDVFLVTASGMGLEPQSSEPGISSRLFGWFFLQRNRTTPLNDPEGCLYGIKDPMSIYQLINELMDTSVGPAGSFAPSFDSD